MGGLWSKWYLALGTLETGQIGLLAVLMVSSLLNVAYLLPIPIRAFFSAPEQAEPAQGINEAPRTCVGALLVTAACCLALFVYPEPLYRLMSQIVSS